jgi:3',5'-cyclic AMP phosphodiesterase CpdA
MRLAVIADPHLHDTSYDPHGDGSGAFRTLAETVGSTRVFNESVPAFRAALDDIVRRGISHVILVGDLTDDGQGYAVACARDILREYERRHGLRFFACVGNHDLFAIEGRHRRKAFLRPFGSSYEVSSDANDRTEVIAAAMHCGGYRAFIAAFTNLGFMRQDGDLLWETPFGTDDAPEARIAELSGVGSGQGGSMVDASYLVEPIEGLWLLSLDTNVWISDERAPAGAIDRCEAGWNAAVRHKPYLLDWLSSVVARAKASGKQLVVFSHYPALFPLRSDAADERALLGKTDFLARMPSEATSQRIAATGARLHFSGHWHVDGASEAGGLVNVAVPSLVGLPAAYKIVRLEADRADIETVPLTDVPGFDIAFPAYAAEAARAGAGAITVWCYEDFLSEQQGRLAVERYLGREWPRDIAQIFTTSTLADLAAPFGLDVGAYATLPMQEVVSDWYRLRRAGPLAHRLIGEPRLNIYRRLAQLYAQAECPAGSAAASFRLFMKMMGSYSADGETILSVPLVDATVIPSSAALSGEPTGATPEPAGS